MNPGSNRRINIDQAASGQFNAGVEGLLSRLASHAAVSAMQVLLADPTVHALLVGLEHGSSE
jgi:hypothetical protein